MRALAIFSLILALVLLALGAYLRLDQAGVGCADWPGCYGRIGAPQDGVPTVGSTLERLTGDLGKPAHWPRRAHRLVASTLGLLALGLCVIAVRTRRQRVPAVAVLALVVFLAWLGMYSAGLHRPAVVMGNLLGGFALLALLGWMVFRGARPRANAPRAVRRWVAAAALLLGLQIALGGLVSANFAAVACTTVPACDGSWLPGGDLWAAFDLDRELAVDAEGRVLTGPEQADIHKLHRLVGAVTAATILVATLLALRARLGASALAVLVVAALEFLVGVLAVAYDIPIGVAVTHNLLAAVLLLGLLRLHALCRNRQALL